MQLLILTIVLLLAACGGSGSDAAPQFIAAQRDFANYRTWSRYDLGVNSGDAVHTQGSRVVYINKIPAHGSTQFPLGTILVKTIGEDTAAPGKTFGMAKRGGGFNAQGSVGWEWFEIDGTPQPIIVWHGTEPPPGEAYNPTGVGDQCNDCHRNAKDGVFGDTVQIDAF